MSIDDLLQIGIAFCVGMVFGYGIAKRPVKFPKPRRRIEGANRCSECGAFHDHYGKCPLVAGGARRIQ